MSKKRNKQTQSPKYDYAKSQTIQDAHQSFTQSVNEKRGITSPNTEKTNTSLEQNHEHQKYGDTKKSEWHESLYTTYSNYGEPSTLTEALNQYKGSKEYSTYDSSNTTHSRNDILELPSYNDIDAAKKYEYTSLQNIKDANAAYEEQINRQRGIPNYREHSCLTEAECQENKE